MAYWTSARKYLLASVLTCMLTTPSWSSTLYWRGPSNTGDSGLWNSGTNWTGGNIPTSAEDVSFDYGGIYTSEAAVVTIGSGLAAQATKISVRLGKDLTLELKDNASLTVSGAVIVGSANSTNATTLLITGPATGSATANLGRIYMDQMPAIRDTTTLSGPNLTVNLSSGYNAIKGMSSLIITDGASVNATGGGGEFYTYSGKSGASYDNRMQILNGSVKGTLIDNTGLTQLSTNGSLAASGGTMNLYVRSEGRFEVEGSGLASSVNTRTFTNGTFAVGLTDPDTAERAAAATLNLSSSVRLDEGSILEMHLFGAGSGQADQIAMGATGVLTNVSTGGILKLMVDDYTLQWGDSWTLFTGATTNITGSFNKSQIDTSIWDISNLNEAGGWTVVSLAVDGYTFTTSSTNAQSWSDTNGWSPVGLPDTGDNAKVWGTAGGTTNQTFLTDGDRTVKNLILGGSNATGQLRLRSDSSDTVTVTETLTAAYRAVALASADTNHVLTVNATNLVVDTKNNANILSLGLSDGRVNLNVAGDTTVKSGAIHINRGDQDINLGHLSLGDKALLLSGTNFSDAGGTNYSVQVRSLSGNAGSAISNGFAAHTTLEVLGENTSAATYSGTISNGAGVVALTKQGAGTQVLAGHNTFTGATTISGGVLKLQSTNGPALSATASLTIASNATLLIFASNQINNANTTVTLSGGTIQRASGVSETFGDLNLTTASSLDYGGGTAGTLTFGAYTPSSMLTVNNFFEGNKLVFSSNLTGQMEGNFTFDNGFMTDWNDSTFTITAIPEPTTMASAIALLGLMLWPLLHRNPHHCRRTENVRQHKLCC